ncbi:MAG: hypothetical protein J5J06_07730 [Phycisphaerae bacterium]|nr:hypothetical protein [Phycisphaerae bacterium]
MSHHTVRFAAVVLMFAGAVSRGDEPVGQPPPTELLETHHDPYMPGPGDPPGTYVERFGTVDRGRFRSVQVNVRPNQTNIPGDAANEPSLAVDPTDPDVIVIGWRQFDTIASDFRQAGYAYTRNGGATWAFPGSLQPGQFRSDPVLGADSLGNIYYYSLSSILSAEMFISGDGGTTWAGPIPARGGDKTWMDIDTTGGIGNGNIYTTWNRVYSCCSGRDFTRSVDGGLTYPNILAIPTAPYWGTVAVGPDGEVYISGVGATIARSTNARNPGAAPTFDWANSVNIGGLTRISTGPNPGGLLGQVWVATDNSPGPGRGNVYLLASVDPPGSDPLDVMFVRSTDGGVTWSAPVPVNDDAGSGAWQWFGTMSVAPNGRIDAIWNDTRASGDFRISEVYYSYSLDFGETWSANVPVTPPFNSYLGWPRQNKIGDYYDMVSDRHGASLAYCATFNGEQDVYFLRIGFDCDDNGVADEDELADDPALDCNGNNNIDSCDVAAGTSEDCDGNNRPDECDPDGDSDGVIDACDNCPMSTNSDQADIDGDGKGNVCDPCPVDFLDDRDGDGACDSDEACPFDPNKIDPGVCGCGVADVDSDGDTVADCVDQCANVDDRVYAPGCAEAIPTTSDWGLVVFAMVLLVCGKVVFGPDRRSA